MTEAIVFAVAGLCLLLAVVLPQVLRPYAISAPMVLVGVGLVIGLFPVPSEVVPSPLEDGKVVEVVTELTILVALMGVGLALDRPLRPKSLRSWRTWSTTWRMIAVAMPLTIGLVALLGWWAAGLGPATALLLGAVLAPTDPVLASDVQLGGPGPAEDLEDLEHGLNDDDGNHRPLDEVRFAVTSEAGLNDGLALPFVQLAVLLAAGSLGLSGYLEWAAGDFLLGIVLGTAVGVAVGWVLGKLAFRSRRVEESLAEQGEPLLALAALLAAFGLAELAHGYGFLAVIACAMTLRAQERGHDYHRAMHDVVERLERLFTLVVLLVLGIATTRGLLTEFDLGSVVVGAGLVFVIRPLVGWASLSVLPRRRTSAGGLDHTERLAVGFFGVRGVGSIYYLAYALEQADFDRAGWLWSTTAFTVVLSVFVHGVAAKPWLKIVDRRRGADGPGLAPAPPSAASA